MKVLGHSMLCDVPPAEGDMADLAVSEWFGIDVGKGGVVLFV
jgi:hypothetical protein